MGSEEEFESGLTTSQTIKENKFISLKLKTEVNHNSIQWPSHVMQLIQLIIRSKFKTP